MRYFLFAVFLVVACATGAETDSYVDAVSAFMRDDNARAAQPFLPLAEQGHGGAQSNLGAVYADGRGVSKDSQESARSWRRAAEQGDAEGQYNLGLMYDKGQGVPQDFIRAYMWYNLAAEALSGDDAMVAIKLRDHVASRMTTAQIEKAQEMARRCQRSKFKECD
jgi:TPR repeat protein